MDTTQHTRTLREVALDIARRAASAEAHMGWADFGPVAVDEHRVEYLDDYKAMIDAACTERTCRDVSEQPRSGFWPAPHFRCSLCGHRHVSVDYVDYCPRCGARVVDEG